jgi:hypothetical protein
MATGTSAEYTLSSAETALYKKTNTDVMEAMKSFTEEYGWLDDTPDIRITPSANEMRLVIDVNHEVGIASIPEGGYEALATSVAAENGTLTPIQLNGRFSFSTKYQKGWNGPNGGAQGQIEKQINFQAMKKTQALGEQFGQFFYGYSTATVAVVATTQGAGATTANIPLKDPYGDTGIDDTSANGLAYLSGLFRVGQRIALVRSAAIVEIGEVTGAGSGGSGTIAVTWNASCTPTADDQIVFANAVTDATLGGTNYNKGLVGFLDATQSASVHGIATSSVPGWASYIDSSGGRWSVAKQKKMIQTIMNNGGVKANRMLLDQGVMRDIEAGESAARRYAPGDVYDLDAEFKAKSVKVLSSRLTPPGVVGMYNDKSWTKKLLNDKPAEQGGPDLFDLDKVQDRGLIQASLDFILMLSTTNRAGMGIAVGLTQQ